MSKTRQPWTAGEDALLARLYPDSPMSVLTQKIGRSERSIYYRANRLGIRKSAAYLSGPHASRLRRGDNIGKRHRFKKGHKPWNAGLKGYQAGGRSAETRFKRGQQPPNWQPIGHERVVGGYLQRKVTDTGYTPADYVEVHRLLWEEHHGPIPAGHIIVFRNGDKADIRMENLELISRAENMRRNSRHTRYPEGINRAIQLLGALKRQINKRESA